MVKKNPDDQSSTKKKFTYNLEAVALQSLTGNGTFLCSHFMVKIDGSVKFSFNLSIKEMLVKKFLGPRNIFE